MADDGQFLDMAGLTVPLAGGLRETANPWMPFEVVDADGGVVIPVAAYLKDVQACGRSEATLRSYGMDLLRWFRPVNCTMSLISSQADRLASRSMVWSMMYDVP